MEKNEFIIAIDNTVEHQFKESFNEFLDRMSKLKEELNSRYGREKARYEDLEARAYAIGMDDLKDVLHASMTTGASAEDIMDALEYMHLAHRLKTESEMVSLLQLPELPSLSFSFLPEPEEEPMPSEAWIKKQLKYEKNPMRIKQLNIMLNKKRKENRRK